jgi:putative phosphoesterase
VDGTHVIGLISDTHGVVRPEVHTALAGVDLILHAGDIGDGVLDELATIAPVHAVYGNTDAPDGRGGVAESIDTTIGGVSIHVSHGHEVGRPTPERLAERYAARVIVYGHTHRPLVAWVDERLVVNPGAAGPRRFDLMPSVGRLTVGGGRFAVELLPLGLDQPLDQTKV